MNVASQKELRAVFTARLADIQAVNDHHQPEHLGPGRQRQGLGILLGLPGGVKAVMAAFFIYNWGDTDILTWAGL